jgi:hypothetical protein
MPSTVLRYRGNVFTELFNNDKGIHRHTRPTALLLRVFAVMGVEWSGV